MRFDSAYTEDRRKRMRRRKGLYIANAIQWISFSLLVYFTYGILPHSFIAFWIKGFLLCATRSLIPICTC